MPCGCLGKRVIYNSLTNLSLPSQNNQPRVQQPYQRPLPMYRETYQVRRRVTWDDIQKDLIKSK